MSEEKSDQFQLPVRKPVTSGLLSESNTHNRGWNSCLDEIAKLGLLYTHVDPAEVERLREELDLIKISFDRNFDAAQEAKAERDILRARRAELVSAVRSINCGPAHAVQVPGDDEPCYPERKEWIEWVLGLCDAASAEPSAPATHIPEGYCVMPRRLTAENGAKALLLGEFKLETTHECPECAELEEPTEDCEICDGAGEYGQRHMIPWDQIKFIYSEAVKGLALKP